MRPTVSDYVAPRGQRSGEAGSPVPAVAMLAEDGLEMWWRKFLRLLGDQEQVAVQTEEVPSYPAEPLQVLDPRLSLVSRHRVVGDGESAMISPLAMLKVSGSY
jgi:hypothetical protein